MSVQLDQPLATVTPTVDGDVLMVLARAEASFTAPRVQQLIGRHSVVGVRKVLQRLVEQGVVLDELVGRTVSYRLNREHLAADAIVLLAGLRDALVQRLRREIGSWPAPPALVMLFGSAARGGMAPSSDVDLLVVALDADTAEEPAWRDQIHRLERDITSWTGNDARILEFVASELGRGRDPVIESVAREGILVMGDRTLLAPMSGRSR